MVKNKELRANARMQLGGIFQNNWLMVLLAGLIGGAILGAVSFTGIGTLILTGIISYGMARICVKLVENGGKEKVDLGDLFKGFSEDAGSAILLGLLEAIFITLWSLLLFIPGIVKSYSYAMCHYIQQDATDKDWKKCIDTSRQWMNGYKWKLFCLDLSFIGWYIVGSLCLGVGVLWVATYHDQARANFYMALKAEHENQ